MKSGVMKYYQAYLDSHIVPCYIQFCVYQCSHNHRVKPMDERCWHWRSIRTCWRMYKSNDRTLWKRNEQKKIPCWAAFIIRYNSALKNIEHTCSMTRAVCLHRPKSSDHIANTKSEKWSNIRAFVAWQVRSKCLVFRNFVQNSFLPSTSMSRYYE